MRKVCCIICLIFGCCLLGQVMIEDTLKISEPGIFKTCSWSEGKINKNTDIKHLNYTDKIQIINITLNVMYECCWYCQSESTYPLLYQGSSAIVDTEDLREYTISAESVSRTPHAYPPFSDYCWSVNDGCELCLRNLAGPYEFILLREYRIDQVIDKCISKDFNPDKPTPYYEVCNTTGEQCITVPNFYEVEVVLPYTIEIITPSYIQVDDTTYAVIWPSEQVGVIVSYKSDSAESKPCFAVTFDADTLLYGESTHIFVEAKKNGEFFDMPSGTLVKFSLDDTGTHSGHLADYDTAGGVTYQYAREGGVSFAADGEVPDSLTIVKVSAYQKDDPEVHGEGDVLLQGKVIMLKIVDPDTAGVDTLWISSTPRMQMDTCKAVLLNYTGGEVTYKWKYAVKDSLPRDIKIWNSESNNWDTIDTTRVDSLTFQYTTKASKSDTTVCIIDFVHDNDTTFIGGEVTIFLEAITSEKTYRDTLKNEVVILGKNPFPQDARSGVAIEIQVIMYKESKFDQFYDEQWDRWFDNRNEEFLPLFGSPDGRGICQVEFSVKDTIGNYYELYTMNLQLAYLWNWQSNRSQGVAIFDQKRSLGIGYPERLRRSARNGDRAPYYLNVTDFTTQEQILKEAFQLYNGGHQWMWRINNVRNMNSGGQWVPRPGRNGYGDSAWQIYSDVNNGIYPADWNR